MTKVRIEQDKNLLYQDICARLPYSVIGQISIEVLDGTYDINSGHLEYKDVDVDVELLGIQEEEIIFSTINETYDVNTCTYLDFTPYLRSMSSMTEKEKEEYCNLQCMFLYSSQYPVTEAHKLFDWLLENHFDYRGLISKGLAIEVNESNNPYKEYDTRK